MMADSLRRGELVMLYSAKRGVRGINVSRRQRNRRDGMRIVRREGCAYRTARVAWPCRGTINIIKNRRREQSDITVTHQKRAMLVCAALRAMA